MKRYQLVGIVSALLMLGLISCTANLEAQKNRAEAMRKLGEAYLTEGKDSVAYKHLIKAEKLYPRDPYVHFDLGNFYLRKGKYDQAIAEYKKSLELKPNQASVINNLGLAYLKKGAWDTAIACFKELINNYVYVTPHYPLSNLGFAYYKKKEYKLAEQYYLEALKIKPKFVIALRGLGRTYIAMGRIPEAVMNLKKGIAISPDIAELYLDLGDAYSLGGNYKKAWKAYKRVVELKPDTSLAREAERKAKKLRIPISKRRVIFNR